MLTKRIMNRLRRPLLLTPLPHTLKFPNPTPNTFLPPFPRKRYHPLTIRRYSNLHPKFLSIQLPFTLHQSIRTQVFRCSRRDRPTRDRSETDIFPAWSEGRDTTYDGVEPVGYGAEGVVVERGHFAGVDGAVGEHGVPTFPHLFISSAFLILASVREGLTVVAPIVIGYNQLGHFFSKSILYANWVFAICVKAGRIIGVPTKPVAILKFEDRTR